jgi:hypothetical protein
MTTLPVTICLLAKARIIAFLRAAGIGCGVRNGAVRKKKARRTGGLRA